MLSGGWGVGLVLSTDVHLYEINSVLGFQASKSRWKMISRAVVLKAHMYCDFCRPLKIQVFLLLRSTDSESLGSRALASVFNVCYPGDISSRTA